MLWVISGSYIPHPVVELGRTRSATSRRTVRTNSNVIKNSPLSNCEMVFIMSCTLIAPRTDNGPSTAPDSFPNTRKTPYQSKRASTNSYAHLTRTGRTSCLSPVGYPWVRRWRLAILVPRHPRVTRWPAGARIRHGGGKMVKIARSVWSWPLIFREVSDTGECEYRALQ